MQIVKKILVISFFSLATFSLLQAQVQERWEQDGRLEDTEVIIEKDKEIILPPGIRKYRKIPEPRFMRDLQIAPNFDFPQFALPFVPYEPDVRVLTVKQEPLEKLYNSHVKIGFGNYLSPYAEGYWHNKRSSTHSLGARVKHHSFGRGPVDGENSAYSNNLVSIDAKWFLRRVNLGTDVMYQRERFHFYGYEQGGDSIPSSSAIQQTFHRTGINTYLESNDVRSSLHYRGDAKFNFLGNERNTQEWVADFNLNTHYSLSEEFRLSFKSDLFLSNYTTAENSLDRWLFRAYPELFYEWNELFIHAGVRIVGQNDPTDNLEDWSVYPDIKLGYYLAGNARAFVHFKGDVETMRFSDMVAINPFLAEGQRVEHREVITIHAALQAEPLKDLNSQVGFRYDGFNNFFVFVNSPFEQAEFNAVYTDGQFGRSQFYLKNTYSFGNNFSLSSGLQYNIYNTADDIGAWHLPVLEWNTGVNWLLYSKIRMNAEVNLMSGIEAPDPQTGDINELGFIPNVNLKFDYLYSDRMSIWLAGENLLNQNYQRFQFYPVRGVFVSAGISYSF
ncbi:MAG: hypothetical protein LAT68_09015 [Cyclobacteriaceae bacterium]|nr:hypothetical protein [Cyclobacteriaceae bacterium]MCH8516455.1 hypothetical protein [Cyclobacteriaceae bacterium]